LSSSLSFPFSSYYLSQFTYFHLSPFPFPFHFLPSTLPVLGEMSVNCLDPGPCKSKWNMLVGSASPGSCFNGNRKLEGMEATQGRTASPHSGHTADGSGHQQSEHEAF
jgi:hypothetical protein